MRTTSVLFATRLAFLAVALAGAVGCDAGLPSEARHPDTRAAASALRDDSIPRGIDDHLVAIARQIPGYGGHFMDEKGVANVYVHAPEQGAVARAVLSRMFAEDTLSVPDIVVLPGAYEFVELTRWRARLARLIGNVPGVWRMGTSERHNRITIGVDSESVADRVTTAIRASGIPLEAVQIVIMEPVRRFADGDSVTSYTSAMRGGFLLYTESGVNGLGGDCTAGPVGRGGAGTPYADRYYMLTAAHCTRTMNGAPSPTSFRQPTQLDGVIGTEAFDGTEYVDGQNTFGCTYTEGCRQADIALVELNGSRPTYVGQIARPKGRTTTSPGTLRIDPFLPFLRVTAWRADRLNGGTVHKVGSFTGWTSGTLVDTCEDHRAFDGTGGYVWVICENVVRDMYASEGDSGAPVFEFSGTGNAVKVVGILTGGTVISGVRHTVYGAIISLQTDLDLTYGYGGHPGVLGGSGSVQWLYGS